MGGGGGNVDDSGSGWVGGGDVGGGGVGVGGGMGYYYFPRSTNKIKIKSFDEILTSEKNYIFFTFFCCGRGSNLILGTGMENQIVILRTPASNQIKSNQILKNCHFGVKRKSLSMQMDLYDAYKSPHTIS